MIEEAGLRFGELEPQTLDMPLGFKTGAGISSAPPGALPRRCCVTRWRSSQGVRLDACRVPEVRGEAGIRETTIAAGDAS